MFRDGDLFGVLGFKPVLCALYGMLNTWSVLVSEVTARYAPEGQNARE